MFVYFIIFVYSYATLYVLDEHLASLTLHVASLPTHVPDAVSIIEILCQQMRSFVAIVSALSLIYLY